MPHSLSLPRLKFWHLFVGLALFVGAVCWVALRIVEALVPL